MQPLTTHRASLDRALDWILSEGPDGYTAFGAALEETLAEHGRHADPGFEQVILFLSDGVPNEHTPAPRTGDCTGFYQAACDGILWSEEAQARGLTVDTFAVGAGADPTVLAEMAERGGGRAFIVSEPGDIIDVLPRISHVGVSHVLVTNRTTGSTISVTPGPDGRFSAPMTALPGLNDIDVTVVADNPEGWQITCATSYTMTCIAHACPPDVVRECPEGVASLLATCSDSAVTISNDSGFDSTPAFGDADAGGVYPPGVTVVTFRFDDDEAGSASCTTRVDVRDTQPPEISGLDSDIDAPCTDVPLPEAPEVFDACDPSPVPRMTELRVAGTCLDSYVLERTWTVTDAAHLSATFTQRVHVDDVTPPRLDAAPDGRDVECGEFVPPPALLSAVDDCDPTPAVTFDEQRTEGPCTGTYQLVRTWNAADRCGNAAVHEDQVIVVQDTTPPTLDPAPADLVIECGEPVPPAPSLAAHDGCDPAPEVTFHELRTEGPCPGTYRLVRTWNAMDDCGNAALPEDQVVDVVDAIPPVMTPRTSDVACLWPPNHWMVGFSLADFAPVAHDACVDVVTLRITGCASDQPDNDAGDGNTSNDCVIAPDGQGVLVRAERAGDLPGGRHYLVSAVATDGCGNVSAPSPIGQVYVPHDSSRHDACIDTTKSGVRM